MPVRHLTAHGEGNGYESCAILGRLYAWRFARYSANDSALWMACCLPLGSFGSYSVGVGSRVASPPPKPLPPSPMMTLDCETRATGAMKAEVSATRRAMRRKRNMTI